jgi:hypothetical protein
MNAAVAIALLATAPRLGAAVLPDGRAAVHAEGGIDVAVPVAGIGAVVGVADGIDLAGAYLTHAGLHHELGITARYAFADDYAFAFEASHGLFAIEELAGVEADRSPLGGAFTTTASLLTTLATDRGTRVSIGASVTLRWFHPTSTDEGIVQTFDLSLHTLRAEVGFEWPGENGTPFVRIRALVPIQADLRVLGCLPMIAAGYTWGFE